MHLYSRAVGLGEITTRPSMDALLKGVIERSIQNNEVLYNPSGTNQDGFFEAQINYSMLNEIRGTMTIDIGGISIRGMYNPDNSEFIEMYYFPYVVGDNPRFNTEIIVERQADKEAYLVHCNEPKREVTPIFFMKNIVEYINKGHKQGCYNEHFVYLSALSNSGKIIMPVRKTKDQIEKCKAATNKRNQLVDKALQGDQDAIDDLTIGDYDMLSDICQRVKKEDVFSIVDSSFIPSGLECDCYSVIGNIQEVNLYQNKVTGEEVYYMTLECNDIIFGMGINRKDLYGMPQTGCRFVGKIWLQGEVFFGDDNEDGLQ